ncbi:hypothetical protein BDZ88DRAFT_251346 [Geranomyces variabilis]|nr:hypothetical protein BDZ88DRAFT_251346 [Geranomyces variabilis]
MQQCTIVLVVARKLVCVGGDVRQEIHRQQADSEQSVRVQVVRCAVCAALQICFVGGKKPLGSGGRVRSGRSLARWPSRCPLASLVRISRTRCPRAPNYSRQPGTQGVTDRCCLRLATRWSATNEPLADWTDSISVCLLLRVSLSLRPDGPVAFFLASFQRFTAPPRASPARPPATAWPGTACSHSPCFPFALVVFCISLLLSSFFASLSLSCSPSALQSISIPPSANTTTPHAQQTHSNNTARTATNPSTHPLA